MAFLESGDIVLKNPIPTPSDDNAEFRFFLQLMVNRLGVGFLRYGRVNRKQRYLRRLLRELDIYILTGNAEQLINIANYCFLEFHSPENKKFHFDNTVDSVTRRKGQ